MAHSAGYLVMIHRLYANGQRDFVDSVEFPKLTSAKRTAATRSRGEGMYATVYDLQNRGQALYQYHKGHQVAKGNPMRRKRNFTLGLPRNKWVNAQVMVTSGGKIRAKVSESVLGHAGIGGSAQLPRLNPHVAYKVYLHGKLIDKVFYSSSEKVEDVKRSLVNHDGYDPAIKVVKERKRNRRRR